MLEHAIRRLAAVYVGRVLAVAISLAGVSPALQAQQPKPQKSAAQTAPVKAEKEATSAKGEQAIVALVNDEPVTGYEIEQRARFLALNANVGDRMKENFTRLVQAESTNQQVRAILDEVVRNNPNKSREQVLAIFEERKKQFAIGLQKQALANARAGLVPRMKKDAQEELIEERLKLQEAKKNGIEVSDDDIKRVLKGLAEGNKMTEEQFAQHLKGMGVDISTMRERFRAQMGWREVIRRRFTAQISVNQTDVDRMVSETASDAGEDTTELQVQRITLPMPGAMDQAAMARRYAEAEALRRKYGGCKTMAGIVKDASAARFEDMKFIKPSSIAEPTRSMLLSAKDGDMLPATTAASGIELYAVCGRRALKVDDKQREKAQSELQNREFEILAKRYLRNLRQDAHIEFR